MNKKTCHWDNEQTRPEVTGPDLQTRSYEMPSSETPQRDGSDPEPEPTDVCQRLIGPHFASSSQTTAVSPLSRTANGQQQSEQAANELRLARLEREATMTGQARTTPSDLVPDQPDGFRAAAAVEVVRTSREVGCQTDAAEVCSLPGSKSLHDKIAAQFVNPVLSKSRAPPHRPASFSLRRPSWSWTMLRSQR